MEEKVFIVSLFLLVLFISYLVYLYKQQEEIKQARAEILEKMKEIVPFEQICRLLHKLPDPDKTNLFENQNDFYFYLQRRVRMSYLELGKILSCSQRSLGQKKYAQIWHYLSYFAINFMSADWLALIYSRAALERSPDCLIVMKFVFDIFSNESNQFLMSKNDKFCEFYTQVLEHFDTALHDQIVDAKLVKSQRMAFKTKVLDSSLSDFLLVPLEN